MPQKLSENSKRGFTLVELLVVIAIIAALAVAVVVTLNPAELIKRARDATRISDLSSIQSAIALYLVDVDPVVWSTTVTSVCAVAGGNVVGRPAATGTTSPCIASTSVAVDGNGWIPIKFDNVTGGSPLTKLPLDPTNTTGACVTGDVPTGCFYVYVSTSTNNKSKLFANLESSKYSSLETKDGGLNDQWYEVRNIDIP